jgi:hypothetical protein
MQNKSLLIELFQTSYLTMDTFDRHLYSPLMATDEWITNPDLNKKYKEILSENPELSDLLDTAMTSLYAVYNKLADIHINN